MDCVNHPGVDAPYNCYRCRAPICVDCETKVEGSSMCRNCMAELQSQIAARYEAETRQVNYCGGFLAGLAAAVGMAFLWSRFAVWTEYRIEAGAALVGGAVGYAVMAGAGDKRGRPLQQVAAILTLFGILLAYYLIFCGTGAASRLAGPGFGSALIAFPSYLTTLEWLDWVFLAVGTAWSYWTPHVRSLRE